MLPIVGHWLDKRREAKHIDEVLRVMSLKVFTNQGAPSLADMKALGALGVGWRQLKGFASGHSRTTAHLWKDHPTGLAHRAIRASAG